MNHEDIARHLAALRARLAEAKDELATASFTGGSDDDWITVTVDAAGRLTDLVINPRILRRPDSEGLAAAVLTAYQRAFAQATQRSNDLWKYVLPADLAPAEADESTGRDLIQNVGRALTKPSEEPTDPN